MARSSSICLVLILALLTPGASVIHAAPQARQQDIVVQVGAFREASRAATLVDELNALNYSAHSVPAADYHRVVVGPFANDAQANAAVSEAEAGRI